MAVGEVSITNIGLKRMIFVHDTTSITTANWKIFYLYNSTLERTVILVKNRI
jgi:hypothetical protein